VVEHHSDYAEGGDEEEAGETPVAASPSGERGEQARSDVGPDGKRRRRRGRRGGRRNRRDRPEGRDQTANGNGNGAQGNFGAASNDSPGPFAADPFRPVTEPAGEQPYAAAREPAPITTTPEPQPETSRRGSTVREPVFFRRDDAPANEPAPRAEQEAPAAPVQEEIAPERPRRSGWWNRGR
jgi:ribonuclease E